MIVLPLFWDQYDNAQRVDETGLRRPAPDVRVRRRRAARRDRPAARRRPIRGRLADDRGGDPGDATASRRPRRRSRPSGQHGAGRHRGDDARRRPSRASRDGPGDALRDRVPRGRLAAGPRRGRRRRAVRREVPRRRPGPARARRGVARRRDRPGARAARAGPRRRRPRPRRSPTREPHEEIHDLLVASVGRNIGLDFLPGLDRRSTRPPTRCPTPTGRPTSSGSTPSSRTRTGRRRTRTCSSGTAGRG